ncbi:hypothetical protein DPEC_G00079120 [Dallia pectoralis]|uniref:Uncharacterized protein n=1 Tax=Dallia pectoralis TaxID=75939 RepID=A0ACC2H4P2_DALPE|nr:hypothetical protein DPEC_G00079120 [Dallia pectoralis]
MKLTNSKQNSSPSSQSSGQPSQPPSRPAALSLQGANRFVGVTVNARLPNVRQHLTFPRTTASMPLKSVLPELQIYRPSQLMGSSFHVKMGTPD